MTAVIEPRKADSLKPREVFRRWLVTKHYSPRTVDCYVKRLLDYSLTACHTLRHTSN